MAFEFVLDKSIMEEEEKVFRGYVETNGVYKVKIEKAELKKSKAENSEAMFVALDMTTEDNQTLKLNIVLTNRKGEDFYIDRKTGAQRKLPGVYEANRLLAVTGLAKKFKGDFSILNGVELYVAVEFKEKEGSEFLDKNVKGFYNIKTRKNAYETINKLHPENILVWEEKFKASEPVVVKSNVETAIEKVEAEKPEEEEEDMFPF